MSSLYQPHPSVVRFLKEFRKRLEIVYNPKWKEPNERFLICEPMRTFQCVDEATGLYVSHHEPFAVRWTNQASEIDQRIVSSLYESKFEDNAVVADQKRRKKIQNDYMNDVDAWARDVGYWHFKKQFGEYSTPLIGRKDPTAWAKNIEDRTGKELKS